MQVASEVAPGPRCSAGNLPANLPANLPSKPLEVEPVLTGQAFRTQLGAPSIFPGKIGVARPANVALNESLRAFTHHLRRPTRHLLGRPSDGLRLRHFWPPQVMEPKLRECAERIPVPDTGALSKYI